MSKSSRDSIKTMACLMPLILLVRLIDSIPWWSFVVVVVLFGILISWRRWEVLAFPVGFLSGFLLWLGATLYFDMTFSGAIFGRIGLVLSLPKILVILIAGLIGGLLTGLALYTGQSVLVKERKWKTERDGRPYNSMQ